MAHRCGCASNICTCSVVGGANVEVTGTGSQSNPYVVSVTPTLLLHTVDTAEINLTITGSGTEVSPYVLQADLNVPSAVIAAPPGMVVDYAGAVAPNGWLMCFGQTVLRASYAGLFTAIGTQFNLPTDNDVTLFRLPDLRGRVTAGLDNMGGADAGRLAAANVLGGATGAETHTIGAAEMPQHAHSGPLHSHTGPSHSHGGAAVAVGDHQHQFYHDNITVNDGGGGTNRAVWHYAVASPEATLPGGAHGHTITADGDQVTGNAGNGATGLTGGTTAMSLLQPTVLLNKIIKV